MDENDKGYRPPTPEELAEKERTERAERDAKARADDKFALSIASASPEERKRYALRVAGKTMEDEETYICGTCGWKGTLQFEPDELEAMGGDLSNYTGPCPGVKCSACDRVNNGGVNECAGCQAELIGIRPCGCQTLLAQRLHFDDEYTVQGAAKAGREAEHKDAAKAIWDEGGKRIGDILGGMKPPQPAPEQTPEQPVTEPPPAESTEKPADGT